MFLEISLTFSNILVVGSSSLQHCGKPPLQDFCSCPVIPHMLSGQESWSTLLGQCVTWTTSLSEIYSSCSYSPNTKSATWNIRKEQEAYVPSVQINWYMRAQCNYCQAVNTWISAHFCFWGGKLKNLGNPVMELEVYCSRKQRTLAMVIPGQGLPLTRLTRGFLFC